MKYLAFSIGLLLAVSPALATGAETPAQPTDNGAVQEDALELARLLNPPEPLLALAARGFDQAFDKGLGSGEEVRQLEKDHPGMVAELRRVAKEATIADLKADMPAIHHRYARFFAANFTPAELAELTAFYRSPTGARIIQAKFAGIDTAGLAERLTKDPAAKMTAGDVEAINSDAVTGMWAGMSAADIQALLAFGLRPVAKKLKGAAPQMAQIEAEIANEHDPELDAAIDAAMKQVFERYGLRN